MLYISYSLHFQPVQTFKFLTNKAHTFLILINFQTHVVSVFHPQYLLPQLGQIVEGRLGGDGVDEDEPLPVLHVQVPHRRELFLRF